MVLVIGGFFILCWDYVSQKSTKYPNFLKSTEKHEK